MLGRGKLVDDPAVIAARKADLMRLAEEEDMREAEVLIDGFLDGTRLFPRRMFNVIAHDADVEKIVKSIIAANQTNNQVGDGKIFILPLLDAYRVRTAEKGDAAI